MNAILKLELLNLQKTMGERIDEIKAAFMPTGKKENRSATELVADYKKEKELLKKYKCKDNIEMVNFLVELEAAARDLHSILYYNK